MAAPWAAPTGTLAGISVAQRWSTTGAVPVERAAGRRAPVGGAPAIAAKRDFGAASVPPAAERTPAAVLAAPSGAFDGSSGAEIHDVRVADGAVEVRTSPARAVFMRSGPWDGCGVDADPRGMHWRGEVVERTVDGAITAARFEAPEFRTWGRIEVRGQAGGRAWSNPFTIGMPNGGPG